MSSIISSFVLSLSVLCLSPVFLTNKITPAQQGQRIIIASGLDTTGEEGGDGDGGGGRGAHSQIVYEKEEDHGAQPGGSPR